MGGLLRLGIGAATALLILSTVQACGDNSYGDTEVACSQSYSGDTLFDILTTSDAVTWGDSVVVAQVAKVEPASPPTGYPTGGTRDGLVGRSVTLEVTSELWNNQGRRPPPVVQTDAWGWTINQGVPSEIRPPGEVTYRTGESYLVTLTEFEDGWGAIGSATFDLNDDSTVSPTCIERSEFATEVDGLAPEAVKDVLAAAQPLSGMDPYVRLPIEKRLEATTQVCKTDRNWC